MGNQKRITMGFYFDLKNHSGNVFNTDTPFGKPSVVSTEDKFAEGYEWQARRGAIADILASDDFVQEKLNAVRAINDLPVPSGSITPESEAE